MMNQLIADFPQQLLDALAIGEKIELRADYSGVQNIVVAGMGGSGIGANFVAAIVQDELNIPFAVSKGYDLPKYVGKNSLVIVSSYSGNTEETVLSMEVAHQRGARIICIASGGKVIDFAKKHGLDFVQLPNNGAPPRACLGYSLVQQLCILQKLGMIDAARIDEVHAAAALLKDEQESIMQKANRMGQLFAGKMPVLYACERMEPVAVRLRQQLNENAKILCLHHVIPEMNHNELVGWREQQLPFLVVFFRSDYDSPRNRVRTNINKEIVSHYSNTIIEAHCKGNSFIEQALYATHVGDWLSWEVAELRKVDSMEVRVIDYLKSQLADVV